MTVARPPSPLSNFESDMLSLEALPLSSTDDVKQRKSEDVARTLHSTTMSEELLASSSSLSEDPLPVLVASSSSSSSASSFVADSWEQSDAVVETILLSPSYSTSASKSAATYPYPSMSWICAPLDYWPACSASVTEAAPCTTTAGSGQQLDVDFQNALRQGSLVALCTSHCANRGSIIHVEKQWNGHLPLDPVPEFFYQYPVLRQRRKHRIPALVSDFDHALFAPSLSMEDDLPALSSSSSSLSQSRSSVCIVFSLLFVDVAFLANFGHRNPISTKLLLLIRCALFSFESYRHRKRLSRHLPLLLLPPPLHLVAANRRTIVAVPPLRHHSL